MKDFHVSAQWKKLVTEHVECVDVQFYLCKNQNVIPMIEILEECSPISAAGREKVIFTFCFVPVYDVLNAFAISTNKIVKMH